MGLRISGLNELRERLERLRPEDVMARALAEQAERMAARVREGLSEPPGTAGHDEPWLRSGALRESVGAQAEGLQAIVGSSDPAAAPQELGTARMPARPFLAPVAAGMGEEVARAVGAAVAAALRGDNPDASGTGIDLSGGGPGGSDTMNQGGAGAGAPASGRANVAGGGGPPRPASGKRPEDVPQEDGIVLASTAGTNVPLVLSAAALAALLYALGQAGPSRPGGTPNRPAVVQTAPPEEEDAALAKPGEATLSEDRRRYILDGDGKGGGGHGPGRGTPKKSEFPSGWSDDKVIDAIMDVANDEKSVRRRAGRDRTYVNGTRDGVDIEVVIDADGKTVVTGYPTNVPRNPRK